MLVQANKTVEECEIRFMELVKYVPYLDINEHHAEHFVYGLNPRIRATFKMWKPLSITEAIECACYAEEHIGMKTNVKSTRAP